MKTKITLTLLLTSIFYFSFGQSINMDAPKRTNTIILVKEGEALPILIEFAKHLQDNGYSIEKLDKDLLSLSTDFKEFKFAGVAVMKIIAFVRQNENKVKIEIKGKIEISNPNGGQVPFDVCNCGMMGAARKNSFKAIITLLESYKFESVEFLEK